MLDLFLEHKVLFFITAVVTFNFVLFIIRIRISLRLARQQQKQFRAEIVASEARMQETFSRISQHRLDLVESMERVVKQLELPNDSDVPKS
jgi:hypothetical protein